LCHFQDFSIDLCICEGEKCNVDEKCRESSCPASSGGGNNAATGTSVFGLSSLVAVYATLAA
jgi:hypothetical protein